MFMVKGEFKNTKDLAKVRIAAFCIRWVRLCIVPLIMYFGDLVIMVLNIIVGNGGVQHQFAKDLSGTVFMGLAFGFFVFIFMYRRANDKLSVYPQTNNSRFISTQILNYAVVVFLGLASLAMYLLYFATINLLSFFVEGVYLALSFDVGFLFVGFFTFVAYSFLIVAATSLIGAILRKWGHYAIIAFTALITLAYVNLHTVLEYLPKVFAFITKEPSVWLFILKAAAIWLVIVAASLVINRYTEYHKTQRFIKNATFMVVCVVVLVATVFIMLLSLFKDTSIDSGSYTVEWGGETEGQGTEGEGEGQVAGAGAGEWQGEGQREWQGQRQGEWQGQVAESSFVNEGVNSFDRASEARIDVSHLQYGSKVNLKTVTENINVVGGTTATKIGREGQMAYLSGAGALDSLQGSTIVIRFRPPLYSVEGIEMFGYANPRIAAHLEGNTLHIGYSIDDAYVVVLPIWGIARQFEIFRDRWLFTDEVPEYSTGETMNANIDIVVE